MVQTVSYIVNECRVSKLYDGGLQQLHSADDVAVNWLEGRPTKALAKRTAQFLPQLTKYMAEFDA